MGRLFAGRNMINLNQRRKGEGGNWLNRQKRGAVGEKKFAKREKESPDRDACRESNPKKKKEEKKKERDSRRGSLGGNKSFPEKTAKKGKSSTPSIRRHPILEKRGKRQRLI